MSNINKDIDYITKFYFKYAIISYLHGLIFLVNHSDVEYLFSDDFKRVFSFEGFANVLLKLKEKNNE